MKLFKKKTVWVLEGVKYDENAKKLETTAVFGVHKDRGWAMAHLHRLGYLNGKNLGAIIDEYGITRIGCHVMTDKYGNLARAREMELEK